MKKLLLLILLFFSLSAANVAYAQQDCQEVDCTGQCGRFIDENADGYCDHGQLSEAVMAQQEEESESTSAKTLIISLCIVGLALVGGVAAYKVHKKKK